jgi:hypothetical protein
MAALTREYCTYFDERYLDKAVALARSLQAHAGSHVLNCVTMTERARQALERMRLPNVVALPIAEIERRDPSARSPVAFIAARHILRGR